jgi:putative ABC transport system ATP-binding protein
VPPEALLEGERLAVGHASAGGQTVPLLSDVSFAVAPGELLIVLGRSGSGKSSLLRLLNRLEEPVSGVVRFRGQPVSAYDPRWLRRRVRFVAQSAVMFDGTVLENLELRPRGEPAPGEARVREALTDVDLDAALLDREARTLSVGEQHRVCMARALLGDPDVLLLDEPTAALDPHTSGRIAELVRRLQEGRRLATVVTTHDPGLVHRLGGRVALLRDGTLDLDAAGASVERFLAGAS